ncbi:MAG: hypothetical protein JO336_05185 [Acidobacteriia bacterium]|nr:hypothetical protein [Terriglobia bacterium]MBV8902307.1 hypothetical protein [Terriglobia bacterium]MBV9742419.1 hypothetical protein [Terriglobia bacterium]
MASILIIDRELGFMWALAERLQVRGIAAIPSSSVQEAERLLDALQIRISLLIINCHCPGVCAFAAQLRKRFHPLRVIGIVSRGFECRACERLLVATLHDPEDRRPERIPQCAELVSILVEPETIQ